MKRRDFIRTSAIAGGSAGIASTLGACQHGESHGQAAGGKVRYLSGDRPEVRQLQVLENAQLKVIVNSDASLEIFDRVNDFTWKSGPVALQELGEIEQGHVWLRNDRSMCEQYPGRFMGEMEGDSIRFMLLGRQNRIFGSFRASFRLEEEWFSFSVDEIEDGIPSLIFPPPIQSGELIIPRGIGQLLSAREKRAIYTRHLLTFFTHLNMRFIGGQKDGFAWIGIYEDGFEDACCQIANGTVTPGFMRSLGKWRHGFSMKYSFIKGSYVDVAKLYRTDFKKKGLFRSLSDKVKDNPDLKKYIGGRGFWISLAFPRYRQEFSENYLLSEEQAASRGRDEVNVHLTYKELQQFIEKLRKFGLQKGFLKIAGWINRGYDASHPDVWPPEPALGTISELKDILGMDAPFALGLHDNYQDMYEATKSFPKGICQLPDGTFQIGGAWAGGQAYIVHGSAGLEYARRNWEKIKTLNPGGMMVDTTTAMHLYQSFEPGKEQTKGDDFRAKSDMVKFFHEQGTIFGSEEVADFAIPEIGWYETRHHRIQGESIPLWPLVFHDAALIMSYGSGQARADENGGLPTEWLEAMQWGYMPHFFYRENFDFGQFSESFFLDEWHRKVALAEMTEHHFLDEAKTVEKTIFSSGQTIICNYGTKAFTVDGEVIEGKNFRVLSA